MADTFSLYSIQHNLFPKRYGVYMHHERRTAFSVIPPRTAVSARKKKKEADDASAVKLTRSEFLHLIMGL